MITLEWFVICKESARRKQRFASSDLETFVNVGTHKMHSCLLQTTFAHFKYVYRTGTLQLACWSLPACMAGVKAGALTCVGWQVTLCDPIWQVTLRSSEIP